MILVMKQFKSDFILFFTILIVLNTNTSALNTTQSTTNSTVGTTATSDATSDATSSHSTSKNTTTGQTTNTMSSSRSTANITSASSTLSFTQSPVSTASPNTTTNMTNLTSTTINTTLTPADYIGKVNKSFALIITELKNYKTSAKMSFTAIGEEFGKTQIRETMQILSAVNRGVEGTRRRRKRQATTIATALLAFGKQLMVLMTGTQRGELGTLLQGIVKGAEVTAKSNKELKLIIAKIQLSIGSDPQNAGKDAADNDINNNDGRETTKILSALESGLRSMQGKSLPDQNSATDGATTSNVVIFVICGIFLLILCVLVAEVVLLKKRLKQNKTEVPNDATEVPDEPEFDANLMTQKTQNDSELEKSGMKT